MRMIWCGIQTKTSHGPLITHPENSELFKDVVVNHSDLRTALLKAKAAKKPVQTLLNGVVMCVFSPQELAESSG